MTQTIYWVIVPSSDTAFSNNATDAAKIKNGQRQDGSAASWSGSEVDPETSGSVNVDEQTAATGLTSGTQYRIAATIWDGSSYGGGTSTYVVESDPFTTGVNASTVLVGASATSAATSPGASGAASVTLSGISVTASAGTVLASAGTNATASLTGASVTAAATALAASGAASKTLTGAASTSAAGTLTAAGTRNAAVTLTGAATSAAAGILTAATSTNAAITLTGAGTTASAGTIVASVTGSAAVTLTGAAATSAAGTLTAAGVAGTGARISTVQSRFGGASVFVPNAGTDTLAGIQLTDHADLDFGTGNFTIELNAYRSSNTYIGVLFYCASLGGGVFSFAVGAGGLISITYRSSGGTQTRNNIFVFPLATWQHVVIQRNGANWETYLEGELIDLTPITGGASSTVDSAADWFFGRTNSSGPQTWNGYIDEIRVTKGAARYSNPNLQTATFPVGADDPHWANVSLLMKFDGADGGTTFTDLSSYGRSFSITQGAPRISTEQSKFGSAVGKFTDYYARIQTPYAAELAFGNGAFTIEFWLYIVVQRPFGHRILRRATSSFYEYQINVNASSTVVNLIGTSGGSQFMNLQTGNIGVGQWRHIAFCWQGSGLLLSAFVDGVRVSTSPITGTLNPDPSGVFIVGTDNSNPDLGPNWYMDELRITKGVARYPALFTPPALPFCEQAEEPVVDYNSTIKGMVLSLSQGKLITPPPTFDPDPDPDPPPDSDPVFSQVLLNELIEIYATSNEGYVDLVFNADGTVSAVGTGFNKTFQWGASVNAAIGQYYTYSYWADRSISPENFPIGTISPAPSAELEFPSGTLRFANPAPVTPFLQVGKLNVRVKPKPSYLGDSNRSGVTHQFTIYLFSPKPPPPATTTPVFAMTFATDQVLESGPDPAVVLLNFFNDGDCRLTFDPAKHNVTSDISSSWVSPEGALAGVGYYLRVTKNSGPANLVAQFATVDSGFVPPNGWMSLAQGGSVFWTSSQPGVVEGFFKFEFATDRAGLNIVRTVNAVRIRLEVLAG